MWSLYVTRRLAVQIAQAWNFGWGEPMKKVYGLSVKNTLVFRDDKKTEYYVDERQHERYVQGLYKLLENQNFLQDFHIQAQSKLESILKISQKKFRVDLSKLSYFELLDLYQNFIIPNTTQFYIRMWTVFNIGEPLANKVLGELRKHVKADETTLNNYLLNLSSPLQPNDVLNERAGLLKLAVQKRKLTGEQFQKRIEEHTKRYCHIPMFDFDHEPYAKIHFINELRKIKNPESELKELQRSFAYRKQGLAKILKNIKPNKNFKKLLFFLKENVFLRDHRDMIRQKLNFELKKVYMEIAGRLGLTVTQVATLTNQEIIKYLRLNKNFPLQEVKKREKAYLLIQKGNKEKIYSGKRALFIARKELHAGKVEQVKEIHGVTGSMGKARGRVAVVYTNKDLHKVRSGDVLVAAMTRQDFIIAIRKAAALVTDEGSVTAHAAIISRELKKPCIVATKIATKVFKDGDMVEVDANKGIVKKF